MDINTIESALSECEQIKSRHDGVHRIHGILSCFGAYKHFISEGLWEECNKEHDFEKDFDFMIKDMRHIDRTGFPLKLIEGKYE